MYYISIDFDHYYCPKMFTVLLIKFSSDIVQAINSIAFLILIVNEIKLMEFNILFICVYIKYMVKLNKRG